MQRQTPQYSFRCRCRHANERPVTRSHEFPALAVRVSGEERLERVQNSTGVVAGLGGLHEDQGITDRLRRAAAGGAHAQAEGLWCTADHAGGHGRVGHRAPISWSMRRALRVQPSF